MLQMSDWVNEWLPPPFPFFPLQWWRYTAVRAGSHGPQLFGCFLSHSEAREAKCYWLQQTCCKWGDIVQRWQRFWMQTLTEEGRPGGTFLIFFGWDSEGRRTQAII